LLGGPLGRPRDIDIVVGGPTVEELEAKFDAHVVRKTRFGGLHLRRSEWEFDIWPVQETYAFRTSKAQPADFSELPWTTFFNLEAVAVDVWAPPGVSRRIYTADDSFFTGLLRQQIEINNEANPFPELCVVRSLVLAASLKWKIGPRLLRYLAEIGTNLKAADLESIQYKHYGRVEVPSSDLIVALSSIRRAVLEQSNRPFSPFRQRQATLWPEEDSFLPRIRLRTLKMKRRHDACSQTKSSTSP
jgi:hypothetical protein